MGGALVTIAVVLGAVLAVTTRSPGDHLHIDRAGMADDVLADDLARPVGRSSRISAGAIPADLPSAEVLAALATLVPQPSAASAISPPPPPPRPGEMVIAPPPPRFEEPPAPPPPPPPALRQTGGVEPRGGVWAVMIGVDDYPGSSSDLRSAVADANEVNEALARFGVPGSQRLLVRNGQATAGTILAAADWLVARAGRDATAVFVYAGHIRKLSPTTEAMVGADGREVRDAELAARLRGLQARQTWIAMAGCYGGGFTEVLAPGRVLTAAADADNLAYENAMYGLSYMVHFMVREAMIKGAAPASVQAAFAYAKAEIDKKHPGRSPVQYDQAGVAIDLRNRPAPTGSSGSSSSPSSSPTTTTPPRDDNCSSLLLVKSCRG